MVPASLDRRLGIGPLIIAAIVIACPVIVAQVEVRRTLYFTARDQSGTYVSDLAIPDLTVNEGGKTRQIVRVEPSDTELRISLAIDEGLSPDAVVRRAAFRFIQQIQSSGAVALYLVGNGNTKLVEYTRNPVPLLKALNELTLRAQGGGNLVESLFELVKAQRSVEGRRVIVVLATELPQRMTVTANGVLDQLRDTNAVLYAVTLVGPAGTAEAPTPDMAHLDTVEEIERDRALNDGTRRSGGLRLGALRVDDFAGALDRIRDELTHQHSITYIVPAGSKSDGRLSITTKRKGVTIRAPSQVPRI